MRTSGSLETIVDDRRVFHANIKVLKPDTCVQYKIWREGTTYLLEIFDSNYYYPLVIRARSFYSLSQYLDPVWYSPDWNFLFD